MKFYYLNTEFTFGKYEGKTLKEVLEIQPSYVEWCAINLEHFYITEEEIEEIKATYTYFKISEEGKNKLFKKYEKWESKQQNCEGDFDDYDNYSNGFDYPDSDCGCGCSCKECDNYGCNANPNN